MNYKQAQKYLKDTGKQCLYGMDHCVHSKCMLARGEITIKQYLEGITTWHWDENWGRFHSDEERIKIHNLIVQNSLDYPRLDKEGWPTINMIALPWLMAAKQT